MGVLALLIVSSLAALADTPAGPAPPVLTEDLVVTIALNNNPALAQAQAELGMARARRRGARSEQELQVSANGLGTLSNMASAIQVPGVMPQAILGSQSRTAADVNLMAMLPLSTGGRIENTIRASELEVSAYEARVQAARVQVAYEARMRFAEWQAAVASRKVAAEAVDFQTEQVRVSEQMCNVGKVPAFDVMRSRAALAARQQDLTSADAEVAAAKARVAQVLATPVDTFGEPANEQRAPLPQDLVGAALAKRPDLAAAGLGVDRAQAVVTARKGSYRPQVYGVGMADLSAPANMGTSAGLTVGVVVGLPLVDAGRRRAEVEEAEQDVLRAKAEVAALELQVKAEVAAAQARLGAALQNIVAAQEQVTAATEGYRVAQIRYQAEKSTVVELLDSLKALTEARQGAVKAKAAVIAAYAEMYRALGVAVPGKE